MTNDGFITWGDDSDRSSAFRKAADNIDLYDGIQKASAHSRNNFMGIEPNRSVRTGFTKKDYNGFRPGEAVPSKQKDAMKMCMDAYDRVGIIRNVIDLMGDFAAQGITITHPNKTIEKFYKNWFNKVNATERSERFLNLLYRSGNVIIRRRTAKVNKRQEVELKKAGAADLEIEKFEYIKREIPWHYDFLNPLHVEIKDQAGNFYGDKQYLLRVSKTTKNILSSSMHNYETVLDSIPEDLRNNIKDGMDFLPLEKGKTKCYHYKKDDWKSWANPMVYSILDDILMLEKMKLADLAALDGAISQVRLWKIGDLEHKILPTKAAINKLRDILGSNVGGGTMDLVWGPELDFKESATQVYRFLGSEKYQPVLTSIYAGLGIPPTLTGAAGGGGYSNNFVSLKTLVERLEYGRDILKRFWQEEIKIIQKAMGFRLPAIIHFDSIVLSDEATEKNLLIQLADRDIISHETLLERFNENHMIEKTRSRREEKYRQNDRYAAQKASPYHHPQHHDDLVKIALTQDKLADKYLTDMGIPTQKPAKPEAPKQGAPQEEKQGPTGRPEDGRPKMAKDTKKRKQKRVLPKSGTASVTTTLWALNAQKEISDVIMPAVLNHYGKKDTRGLTKAQVQECEDLKLAVLTATEPNSEITPEAVKSALDSGLRPSSDFLTVASEFTQEFEGQNNRSPNTEEMRYVYASAYASIVS